MAACVRNKTFLFFMKLFSFSFVLGQEGLELTVDFGKPALVQTFQRFIIWKKKLLSSFWEKRLTACNIIV